MRVSLFSCNIAKDAESVNKKNTLYKNCYTYVEYQLVIKYNLK